MPQTKSVPYVPKQKAKDKTRLPALSRRLNSSTERQKYLKVPRGSTESDSSSAITRYTQSVISYKNRNHLATPEEQKRAYEQFYLRSIPDPRTLLGYGGLDPFNAFCVKDEPLKAQEMLDHGKSPQVELISHCTYALLHLESSSDQ